METKRITVGIFDYAQNGIEIREIDDILLAYYSIIGCDTIDVTIIRKMNVVVDDNGLLTREPLAYVTMNRGLVGRLVFVGPTDEDGNFTSLTPDNLKSIDLLRKRIKPFGHFIDKISGKTTQAFCIFDLY
jgi:hypothetical protein